VIRTLATAAQRILHLLSIEDRLLSPPEIARNTKIPPNQVRARLCELRKAGKVDRPFRGYYVCDPTYGVGVPAPRIQNLRVTARGVPVASSDLVDKRLGDLRIRVTFGKKRGIISYTVKADKGLDVYGLRLCHTLVNLECEVRGYRELVWTPQNFGLLFDHESVRLEGVTAIIWEDLEGTLEKYYNRETGMRREIRGSSSKSVQDLEALIQGGVTTSTVMQGLNVLRSDISSLNEVVRGIHYSYEEMRRMFKADHEAVTRLVGLVEKLIEAV